MHYCVMTLLLTCSCHYLGALLFREKFYVAVMNAVCCSQCVSGYQVNAPISSDL